MPVCSSEVRVVQYWILGIIAPLVLAAMALFGYRIGRRQPRLSVDMQVIAAKSRDMHRAADELVRISSRLRQNLAAHHSKTNRFLNEIRTITERWDAPHAGDGGPDIQRILAPADQLSQEIAAAYNALRQHSESLNRLQQ
jgi:hypothetical protein